MKTPIVVCALLAAGLVASCQTTESQAARLVPRWDTGGIRIEEIRRQVGENPILAIDLIHAYRHMYRIGEEVRGEEALTAMEEEATANLASLFRLALDDGRWELAASLGRSLANVGQTDFVRQEPEFTLAWAKDSLEKGDNLGAFLSAANAHRLSPLSADDAMPFLERAVEGRQRGTAAFFLDAVDGAGGGRSVRSELRQFAQGRDSPADMIRGVATVIVDRGFRAERGRVTLDRVGGTAFFVDASGLLITNYHVIESEVSPTFKGNSRMFIRLGDSTSPRIPAKVVGWDKTLDLALISAPIRSDFVFSVVDRAVPRVGESVIVIGSPVGLEQTVTSGIASAMGRRFLQIGDVMQIDAPVNHGNSGGPVVDAFGRLVGVVFAGMMEAQGLNFVIPAERLASALPAMIRGGRAERPWL
ncbi:MAG: S1C family serine protease, partial [Treponema sp.]|nr:S1C family serine protease [Treponema sp.]